MAEIHQKKYLKTTGFDHENNIFLLLKFLITKRSSHIAIRLSKASDTFEYK